MQLLLQRCTLFRCQCCKCRETKSIGFETNLHQAIVTRLPQIHLGQAAGDWMSEADWTDCVHATLRCHPLCTAIASPDCACCCRATGCRRPQELRNEAPRAARAAVPLWRTSSCPRGGASLATVRASLCRCMGLPVHKSHDTRAFQWFKSITGYIQATYSCVNLWCVRAQKLREQM